MKKIITTHIPSALRPSYCPRCDWNTAGIASEAKEGERVCPACKTALRLPYKAMPGGKPWGG